MLLTLVLFLLLSSAQPQPDPVAYWDAVLVQYEKLSEASLKKDNSKEISQLKKTLDEMLKNPIGKMNDEQNKRFLSIKNRHAGIEDIQIPPSRVDTLVIIQQVPVEKIREIEHVVVTDTVTKVEPIGKIQMEHVFSHRDTTVVMHVLSSDNAKSSSSVRKASSQIKTSEPASPNAPKAMDSPKIESIVKTGAETSSGGLLLFAGLAAAPYPDFSAGGVIGAGTSKIGGYIKGRGNFNAVNPAYSFDSSGQIAPGQYFWGDGTRSLSRIALTTGAYFAIVGKLSAYAGAGWGRSCLYYRDITGQWAELKDVKSSGVALDAGVGFNPGRFRIFAGVNCTSFSYIDFEIGVAFDIIKRY